MKTCFKTSLFIVMLLLFGAAPEEYRFADRLSSLRAGDASSYFKLGEDIAGVAQTDTDRKLAIRLFVLADQIDHNRYYRSALLAIRPLLDEEDDSEALQSLEMNLKAISSTKEFVPSEASGDDQGDDSILAVVEFLSAFRRADRSGMEEYLSQNGVRDRIKALKLELPGDAEWMLAKVTAARPGTQFLSEEDIMKTLRVQARLLGGEKELWSTELHSRHGHSMTIIDPQPLAEIFDIDPDKLIWEKGQWKQVP